MTSLSSFDKSLSSIFLSPIKSLSSLDNSSSLSIIPSSTVLKFSSSALRRLLLDSHSGILQLLHSEAMVSRYSSTSRLPGSQDNRIPSFEVSLAFSPKIGPGLHSSNLKRPRTINKCDMDMFCETRSRPMVDLRDKLTTGSTGDKELAWQC